MYLYTFVCATEFHKICNKIDLLVSASKHVSNTDAVMLGRLQCNEAIEIFYSVTLLWDYSATCNLSLIKMSLCGQWLYIMAGRNHGAFIFFLTK